MKQTVFAFGGKDIIVAGGRNYQPSKSPQNQIKEVTSLEIAASDISAIEI
jgi:hypothetical protein